MELIYYFGRDEDERFEYEVDFDTVFEAAINYYSGLYNATTGGARSVLAGLISDDLLRYEEDEDFIEFLKEICQSDAEEAYNDYKEYQKDPYAYYGVSRSDFF